MYVCRSVISIGPSALAFSGLTIAVVPTSVTFIGWVTIERKQNDVSIVALTNDILSCDCQGALYYCRGLREVSLPTSLRSIPDSSLLDAGASQSIAIPS